LSQAHRVSHVAHVLIELVLTASTVVSTWFPKRRGFAIGFVAAGASTAGFIYPLVLNFLIPVIGFNNAQFVVAGVVTITCAMAFFAARPNPDVLVRKPEKWGVKVFFDREAFQCAMFWWMTVAIMFLFLGFYPIFFNLEEWAVTRGIGFKEATPGGVEVQLATARRPDAIRTYWLTSALNISSIVGRLSSGYLSDKFGALRVHCFVTFVASILVLAMLPFQTTVTGAVCFVVFFGMFSGSVIGLPPASMSWILGNDQEAQAKLGTWVGMMYTFAAVPSFVGPVLVGYGLNLTGRNFWMLYGFSGSCLLLSAACMGVAIYMSDSGRYKVSFRRRFSTATVRRLVSRADEDGEQGSVARPEMAARG
jgi:MCP family monocarboxylic acid transporter-like MFS transporter 10